METRKQDPGARVEAVAAIISKPLPVPEGKDIQEACPPAKPAGHHHGAPGVTTSERHAIHGGHVIKIKTTYEITIDGKPFERHLGVNEEGRLHCHVLPYDEYPSAVDLVRDYIDAYPDLLPDPTADDHRHGGTDIDSHGDGH